MSTPKFSPGPWKVDERSCHSGNIATVHGCTAGWAEIWSEHWMDVGLGPDVRDANIALIAAAPELYQSLLEMVEDSDDVDDGELPKISAATLTRARQALAKAVQP